MYFYNETLEIKVSMWRAFALFLVLIAFSPACNERERPNIPTVYVNIPLWPNGMDYITPGGYMLKNGGYRGILIYRVSMDEFMVYERCCPHDPDKANAQIKVEASGITAICPSCGSKFNLLDGSPIAGPSAYMLLRYNWSYNGEMLNIYN